MRRWLAAQLDPARRVWALWRERHDNPVAAAMRVRMGYGRVIRTFVALEWCFALLIVVLVLAMSARLERAAGELLGLGGTVLGFGAAIAAFVLFSFRRSGFDSREELEDLHGTLLTREEIAFGIFYPIAVHYGQLLLPPLAILLIAAAVGAISDPDGEMLVASVYIVCAAVYWIVSAYLATMRVWLDPGRNLLRLIAGTFGGLFLRAAIGTMIGMASWMLIHFALSFSQSFGLLARNEVEMLTMVVCAILYPILTVLFLSRDLRATAQRAGHQILTPAAPEIHAPAVAAFAEREAKADLRKVPVLRTIFRAQFWRIAVSGVITAVLLLLVGYVVASARAAAMGQETESGDPRIAHRVHEVVAYLLLMPPGFCLCALGSILLGQYLGARDVVVAFAHNRAINAKTLCTSIALVPGCTIIAFGGLWTEIQGSGTLQPEYWLTLLALSTLPPFVLGSVITSYFAGVELAEDPQRFRRTLLVLLSTAAVLWFGSVYFSEPFRDFDFLLLLLGGVFGISGFGMEWYTNGWPVARQQLHERYSLPNEPGAIVELSS